MFLIYICSFCYIQNKLIKFKKVFEKRVLRTITRPREKVTRGWRKPHTEESDNLLSHHTFKSINIR